MKLNYLLIIFLLFSTFGFAQKKNIEGIVKEKSTGLPLYGVNIMDKNSGSSVVTDFDGKFSLQGVSSGTTLVFTYIGFKSITYIINEKDSNIAINLEEDTKMLNEVVVIGYGSVTKKQVTGSVSVVDSKTIEALRPVKIEQALQGTVSGVNVTTVGGAPGADISVRIRGISTNGENKPIAIIDGYQGDLSTLNPSDIESLTVLKDAQAAIYGTIGANGVILVTTKTGKKNSKAKVSFNMSTGIQETSRNLPMLNGSDYALLLNESYVFSGQSLPFPNVSGIGKGTNWQKEIFKAAQIINYDLSISGGSDKVTYAVSASHLDQEGIVGGDKSAFSRNTARVSLGADVTDRLKLKTNITYTFQTRNKINDNGLGSVLFNALNIAPTQSPYDSNGNYSLVPAIGFGAEIINPLAQIDNTYDTNELRKFNGNIGLDYKLTDAFTVSGSAGFNNQSMQNRNFSKIVSYGGKVFDVTRSSVTQDAIFDNNYSIDIYGTYSKKFGEHNIVGTLGTTVFKEFGNGLYATGFDVPYNSWDYADISLTKGLPKTPPNNSYNYDERRLSYFARAQYDFKGRYLLSAMLRRDSSTKFGPNNRVAYFPSMTAGWIISDENFFGDADNSIVNFLKLRGSYGVLGNDQIPKNGYVALLTGESTYVYDDALIYGTAAGQLPNPNLKWEEAKKFDVGVDLRMFQNKVSIVADYFIDKREDLLIPWIPVSGILGVSAPGASPPTLNAGSVKNSGLEFAIDYKTKFSNNLSLSLGYNVTFLKNEVIAVNNGTGYIESGDFGVGQALRPARMQVGKPIGYFFGYKTNGIFQNQAEVDSAPSQIALGTESKPGDIRYVDIDGNGVINDLDRTDIGNPIPAATMGFNLNLDYKNFDFVAYTFASLGNEMVRNYERALPDVNRLDYAMDRWHGAGTSNTVPRITTEATTNSVFSNYYVEDASYIRIQNVQLGYSIDPDYFKKAGVSKFRVYMGVNNLYTFTKYKGYDPGASSGASIGGGIDNGFYPIPRTYMLGLNVNF